ncbi:MAG: methylglyoxal synthase [Defluviitaleaceae bacterium]|nr:methylglyoxal synthase [Defluviitaleaceae bacterium]
MEKIKYTYSTESKDISKQKTIALIAHDNKKSEMVRWAKQNKEVLQRHFLCGTGTTAGLITEATSLPVTAYKSGPLGGDQQIGAHIVEGSINMMIFFWDPLESQAHDPDIKALLRIAVVYDIPIATNRATADFLLTSQYMDCDYRIEDIKSTVHLVQPSEE